jgi:hypothetical protein
MKNFTRARGNSEKSFIYFPKEERVDGIEWNREHALCRTINRKL